MGPQMYNPSPNMMGQPNNGYGSPQTANYYNPYYVNPNYNQQVPSLQISSVVLIIRPWLTN